MKIIKLNKIFINSNLDLGVPPAPTGLSITDSTPNSVTLEWNPVAGKNVQYMAEFYDPELGIWVPGSEVPVRDNTVTSIN